LRVYEPYEAQHLDWYIDCIGNDAYSRTSSAAISHWNNVAELAVHEHVSLNHSHFYVVRKSKDGNLDVRVEQLGRADTAISGSSCIGPILPYADATESQRSERVSHTEALRHAGATDLDRWQNPFSHLDFWRERGRLLAGFVRAGEQVFEFGAGNSVVPEALPDVCRYAGSDIVPLKDGLVSFDLNSAVLRPLPGHDVALFSGVLEYVHDLPRVVVFLSENFRSVVCSYAAYDDSSADELARRRYSGWFNDLNEIEFVRLFSGAGYRLNEHSEWQGQKLFRFDRIEIASEDRDAA
jgi:hypothetical protein